MPITSVMDPTAFKAIVSDNWKIRRRWMKYSLLWMGGNIEAILCWTMVTGQGALLIPTMMTLITAFIAILTFYIFGAIYDDHSKRQHGEIACSPGTEPETPAAEADDSTTPVKGDNETEKPPEAP